MQIEEQVCNYWCKAFFDDKTKKIRYIALLKNRPIQNEDYTLYRIKKMYLFSFTTQELKALYAVYKKNHNTFMTKGSRWVIDSNSILKWLKEDTSIFQDILFWDNSVYLNDKPFLCLEELNDTDIITVPVVNIEDFKKITNETAADRRLKEKKLRKAKNQRLLNTVLLPTLTEILQENGLCLVDSCVKFKDTNSILNFVIKSLESGVCKKLEEAGFKIKLNRRFGKLTQNTRLFELNNIELIGLKENEDENK